MARSPPWRPGSGTSSTPRRSIDDRQELRTYECDGLAQYKVIPALVALPHSADEVAAVVRACAEAAAPASGWPTSSTPATATLHPLVLFDDAVEGQSERAEEV